MFFLQDVCHSLPSGPITSHVHSAPDHGMMTEGVVAVGPYTGTGDHLSLYYQNTCFWFMRFSLLVKLYVHNNQMQILSSKEFIVDDFVFLHTDKGFTISLIKQNCVALF